MWFFNIATIAKNVCVSKILRQFVTSNSCVFFNSYNYMGDANQKFRMEKLLEYSKSLRKAEIESIKKFNATYKKAKNLSTANQSVSGTAVASAAGSGATALTVIALPVSASLAGVGCVLGTVSLILSGVQKSTVKKAVNERKNVGRIRKAMTEPDLLIGVGLDKSHNLISSEEFTRGKNIYESVMKTVKLSEINDLEQLPLEVMDEKKKKN